MKIILHKSYYWFSGELILISLSFSLSFLMSYESVEGVDEIGDLTRVKYRFRNLFLIVH